MARGKRRDTRPIPAHPYRDTALVYGGMAGVLVLIAALTGGNLIRAVAAAVLFFTVATGWTWWKFRTRIRERDSARATPEGATVAPAPAGSSGANGSTDGTTNANGRGGTR